MAYQFVCDEHRCINCGACMDVCPIRCLNMTRPTGRGVEPSGQINEWMMEFPVQTAKCTGCNVCLVECPTEAISIASDDEEPTYATAPEVTHKAKGPDLSTWVPLSNLTRDPFRRATTDPWGGLQRWKVAAHRKGQWQVWRTWSEEDLATEKEEVKR